MVHDKALPATNAALAIVFFILVWVFTIFLMVTQSPFSIAFIIISVLLLFCSSGFFIIQPSEARVVTLFGNYIGTIAEPGFYFTYPFTSKNEVSLKVVNIHTEKMKVNDARGNPIEIAAVIVWQVTNPFKAFFDVANYRQFVATQSDAAIRTIASHYPYDAHDEEIESLRSNQDAVSTALQTMLQQRLEAAGVSVVETRISDLSYAPEIAQSMLRRQQAEAQIAARRYIVDNAVTIVEEVIGRLEKDMKFKLENAQKVQIVNNLLIALVTESDAKPVINIGQ